jgi:hypothetical protein
MAAVFARAQGRVTIRPHHFVVGEPLRSGSPAEDVKVVLVVHQAEDVAERVNY